LGQAYADVLSVAHRRALGEAADVLIDTTIDDLSASDDPGWTADNWLIGTMLPQRYRLKYTGDFARWLLACLMTVVWKLSQREPIRPSCVAEELAVHILLEEAEALAQEHGIELEFDDFRDAFFEDLDFEFLYDDAYDGIETADIAEGMGITNLAFADWFERFGAPEGSAYTEVHPYARGGSAVGSDSPTS
jgi:hypothetical protein